MKQLVGNKMPSRSGIPWRRRVRCIRLRRRSSVKAEGVHVVDVDGRRLLDAVGGLWNVNLGYSASREAGNSRPARRPPLLLGIPRHVDEHLD